MNKQLAKPQLTTAELLCCREGTEESLSSRTEARSPGWLSPGSAGACYPRWLSGAKPRCSVSLLSCLVRSAIAFTAFQVFLNHLQKQD